MWIEQLNQITINDHRKPRHSWSSVGYAWTWKGWKQFPKPRIWVTLSFTHPWAESWATAHLTEHGAIAQRKVKLPNKPALCQFLSSTCTRAAAFLSQLLASYAADPRPVSVDVWPICGWTVTPLTAFLKMNGMLLCTTIVCSGTPELSHGKQ